MINPLMNFKNTDAFIDFLESDNGGQKFIVKKMTTNAVKIAGCHDPKYFGEYVNFTITKNGFDSVVVIGNSGHGIPLTNNGFESSQNPVDFKNALLAHLQHNEDELNGAPFDIDKIDTLPPISLVECN